ncbi:hypothetical protein HDU92_005765 [Lobulomyces angularis]|nr:hypothetical protein HDU92_005765 [Lobulomyces angularis]
MKSTLFLSSIVAIASSEFIFEEMNECIKGCVSSTLSKVENAVVEPCQEKVIVHYHNCVTNLVCPDVEKFLPTNACPNYNAVVSNLKSDAKSIQSSTVITTLALAGLLLL